MNYCIYTKKQNNSVILSCLLTPYLGYSSEPVSWSLVPATCQRLKQVVKECFTKANEWLSSQWIDYYQLFPHVHLKTFSTLVSWVYFSYLMAREWSQDDQPRLHWKTRYQFRLGKSLVPTDPTFRYWSHLFGTCHYLFSRQLLFFHHLVRLNKFVNQINMLHAFLIMLVHMLQNYAMQKSV